LAAALLVACNSPSSGGPGLEPPGGGSSGSGFGNGTGEDTPSPTGNVGMEGAGAGAPALPDTMEPPGAGPAQRDAGLGTPDGGAGDAGGGASDAGDGVTSCDRRKLACKRADPTCPEGEVPAIVAGCFGACVPIDACACDAPEACPDANHYTCHNYKQRCGPYL
jgi:hypothetical protein